MGKKAEFFYHRFRRKRGREEVNTQEMIRKKE